MAGGLLAWGRRRESGLVWGRRRESGLVRGVSAKLTLGEGKLVVLRLGEGVIATQNANPAEARRTKSVSCRTVGNRV